MLTVQTPAADRGLLTIEELRAAAGVTGTAQDQALLAQGLRVADMMAREAGIEVAGVTPPTFRAETLVETFRRPLCCEIILARRFVTEVVAISEDGQALDAAAYELDAAAGMLRRIDGGRSSMWRCDVSVTYKAGFAAVPEDLKQLAIWAFREMRSADGRDPLLRSETTDGVGRWDWQMGGSGRGSGSPLPPMVVDGLAPYRSVAFA